LYKRSLDIFERVLGKEHPNIATILNNLGLLYHLIGDYTQAKPLYERSLVIREKVLGEDHPDVATSLNNLAELYESQGSYVQAKPLLERSLAITEKALGKEHPDFAIRLNNFAGLYYAQGDYAQARLLYERSLKILENVLDKEHPNVLTAKENLKLSTASLEHRLKVRVTRIIPESPAAKMGIQVGDIFTKYDNNNIINMDIFIVGRNQESKEGAPKLLQVLRNGKELTFMISPGKIGAVLENYIIEKQP